MENFFKGRPKYTGMGICILPFLVLLLSFFTACEQPTWNDPVREYFEYYTETAAIERYELLQEANVDSDGNVCLSSESDKNVTLYLRNPKKYTLLIGGIADTSGIDIVQDTSDPTVFHLTFSEAYLKEHEYGQDIGGVINLTESVTLRPFEGYDLALLCNSPPPQMDVAIMKAAGHYVIAFQCPDATLCKDRHTDIEYIVINGTSYPCTVDSGSGAMSFSDSNFISTAPSGLQTINRNAPSGGAVFYFTTTDPVVEGTKSYTIGLVDSAGLKNIDTVSTSVKKLASPAVKDNANASITAFSASDYTLYTDSEEIFSTVSINPLYTDETGNDVEGGVTAHWILYEVDGSGNKTKINPTSGDYNTNTDPSIPVQIPQKGRYVLEVWAENSGCEDSQHLEYNLNLVYATLKAPVVKKVEGGTETECSASTATTVNNYVELGTDDKATIKIYLPSKTTGNVSVNTTNAGFVYTINPGYAKADNATETPGTTVLTLSNLEFGQYCLTVYGTKPGYNDSAVATYLIKAHKDGLYIKSSSAASNAGSDTTGDGSYNKPYATVQKAVTELAAYNKSNGDYTINVIGEVTGPQTISNVLNSKASTLTLKGQSTGTLNGNRNLSNKGTTLTVDTSVPVIIQDLTITGGYYPCDGSSGDGGGIYIKNGATVKLAGGAKVTGNEAYSGGGVYVAGGGKLFMYGAALIGDDPNSTTVADDSASGRANKAQFGGGIYCDNGGTVYMGYSAVGAPEPVSENYGIKRNYSTSWAGGVNLKGSMYLASGEISYNYVYNLNGSNEPKGQGGGIRLERYGMLNMSGGKIKGNESNYRGGGIYFTSDSSDPSSALNISGGTIESNTAGSQGGAIFAAKTFSMSGGISIPSTGAKKNNDVHLQDANVKIKITENLTETTAFWLTGTNELYTEGRTVIQLGSNDPESWYAQKIKVIDNNTTSDDFNWFICHEKMARGFYLAKALALLANGGVNQTIKIADNLTAADITSIKNAINTAYANNNATRLILDLSGVSLTSLPSSAFMDCMGLSKITLPEGLTSIDSQAFRDCSNLTEVHLPSTIPLSGTQNYLTFYGTTAKVMVSEKSPYLSNGTNALYSKDGKKLVMYNNKSSTSGFTVPASVQEICNDAFSYSQMQSISFASSTNLKKLGSYVFADAPNLVSANLPNSIETIGNNCFRYNTALTSINIPTSLTIIPQSFCCHDCAITRIVIPNGVTKIENSAFWDIGSSFTSIVIPTSVTTIGKCAFGYCGNLTDVYYRGSESQKNSINISSEVYEGISNSCLLNATWHYNYTGS